MNVCMYFIDVKIQISFWCSSLAHGFEHQSISTPTSLLIVRFTVLAVYTHSEIISGLYAITTFRVNANSVSSLGSQISYCACISPPNHFFLSGWFLFSGWFLCCRSVLVFLSLPIFFVSCSLFWMISFANINIKEDETITQIDQVKSAETVTSERPHRHMYFWVPRYSSLWNQYSFWV